MTPCCLENTYKLPQRFFYLQNLGMDQIRLTSVVMHLHEWLLLEGGRWLVLGEWGWIV